MELGRREQRQETEGRDGDGRRRRIEVSELRGTGDIVDAVLGDRPPD